MWTTIVLEEKYLESADVAKNRNARLIFERHSWKRVPRINLRPSRSPALSRMNRSPNESGDNGHSAVHIQSLYLALAKTIGRFIFIYSVPIIRGYQISSRDNRYGRGILETRPPSCTHPRGCVDYDNIRAEWEKRARLSILTVIILKWLRYHRQRYIHFLMMVILLEWSCLQPVLGTYY